MSTEPIIERIKKLLRLAADKRGNPHEAERALQLAFELAEKHRVEIESLDLDEKSAELVHEFLHMGARLDRIRQGVFSILGTFFHVYVVIDKPRVIMVGRREDVVIARYVHDFLIRAARNCVSSYSKAERRAKRKVTTRKRASFIAGFLYAIVVKLNESRQALNLPDSTKALVIAEEAQRKEYFAAKIGKAHQLKFERGPMNKTALERGWDEGQKTNINSPLTAAPGGQQLALL